MASRYFAIVSTLLVTSLPVIAEAQASKDLEIGLRHQHSQVWCWAATIAMVVEYLKSFNVEDCEVLAEYDMRLGGRGLCCLGANECARTGGLAEMGSLFSNVFGIHGQIKGPLPFGDIVEEIDHDRPLIAVLQRPGGGHVVVLAGYREAGSVLVLDPIYGRSWASYGSLKANWQYGIWTNTFVFSTDRGEGGCNRIHESISTPFGPIARPRIQCN
jgi:hypothetical protein